MSEYLQGAFAAFLGLVAGLPALAYLSKQAVEHWLNKTRLEFANQLQQQRENKLEELKLQYRLVAHEREEKFSAYHDKQVETLAALYKFAARVANAGFFLAAEIGPTANDEKLKQLIRDANVAIKELETHFEENLVFVPDSLHKTIERMLHRMREKRSSAQGWYIDQSGTFEFKSELDDALLLIRNEVKSILTGAAANKAVNPSGGSGGN